MIDQATGIVWQLVDAWNSHDTAGVIELYTEDYEGIDVGEPSPQVGLAGASRSFAAYVDALPDLHFQVTEVITQGDRVSFAWAATGTHLGRLMNIPATGQKVDIRGLSMITLSGGRIRRALHIWDVAGLLRDIGLLPDL